VNVNDDEVMVNDSDEAISIASDDTDDDAAASTI
jgi:hypothetical protein